MGLYIKGLRIPKKGRYTSFTVYSDGRVVYKFGGDHAGQAIEVPAHGELIDAGTLCRTLRSLAENEYTPEVFANWIENHIDTIIPTEEET